MPRVIINFPYADGSDQQAALFAQQVQVAMPNVQVQVVETEQPGGAPLGPSPSPDAPGLARRMPTTARGPTQRMPLTAPGPQQRTPLV
jgi:hypothetical protein|tara:strand:+ start:3080 stop:3343 length:264 start_codon:yes stop_codon:yes gene_type:complete